MGHGTTPDKFREREPTEELPPPFDQIKFIAGGAIIGKEIYTKGNHRSAVEAVIRKANQTWKLAS